MFDASKLITDFHSEHVRLTNAQRGDMRTRRDANVNRIKSGLAENGKPEIAGIINQGGYAMKTMTQPAEASDTTYDIDLGVVFEAEDAASPKTTRTWVLDALTKKATAVKGEPEDKGKCIRIEYAEGYQCDFPVFKREWNGDNYIHYIALRDDWTVSSPAQINDWLEREVKNRSPEDSSPYQLRRVIRLMKFLGKTWAHASGRRYPSGLLLTALTVEAYKAVDSRLDEAFYRTLRALGARYSALPVYADGIEVSSEKDADRIERFCKKAGELADLLEPLDTRPGEHDADSARALWKKVFRHSFFNPLETKSAKAEAAATAVGGLGLTNAVFAERSAAAVAATAVPSKPWGAKD
ncbi:MAG TPA: hypothetical protein VGC35_07355 [Allosphingosinicella sp.]|jgi:hypothetical protein